MSAAPAERIARYTLDGEIRVGRVDGDTLVRLDAPPWLSGRATGARDALARVTLLPPAQPTKVVCVGLNYRAHIVETRGLVQAAEPATEPLLFLKPPSAVIASGAPIVYPRGVTRLDPEGELAVVIARRAHRVNESDAAGVIAGLTCFNDVSARNYQKTDGQWTRAKGFDTFAPLGPWIAVGLESDDLGVECRVNGEVRQHARTADLLFPVPRLIAHISRIMTLEPGDVIATGTPAGIAPVEPGDVIEIEVEGVGTLTNRVEAESA